MVQSKLLNIGSSGQPSDVPVHDMLVIFFSQLTTTESCHTTSSLFFFVLTEVNQKVQQ